MRILTTIILLYLLIYSCDAQENSPVVPGADRSEVYLPFLMGKNVGVVANQTSITTKMHLVDFLISKDIKITRIFSPEHGFRGTAENGAYTENERDIKTGLEIISLYGSEKKPTPEELQDIELMIFDLQDVGVRFYTYLSTLHFVMEACAENNIPLIILDRPNPNGNYVDGPVLEDEFHSFIGLHPVPVVYGMTIGEYARMINGEKWLEGNLKCELKVIKCENYTHSCVYIPPVKPSPNLPNFAAIKLYPSLCFFEGTEISIGRGTDFPFQVFGNPSLQSGDFYFTPESRPGASLHPKMEGENCRGYDLRSITGAENIDSLNLGYLILAYENFPAKEKFFNSYFIALSGTRSLQKQIAEGLSAGEIRESWKEDLDKFKLIRQKYLLYEDF